MAWPRPLTGVTRHDEGEDGAPPAPRQLQITHLVGVALGVSFLMAAGIHWLHRLPAVSGQHGQDQAIQVRLVAVPNPASPQQAASPPAPPKTTPAVLRRPDPVFAAAQPSADRVPTPHLVAAAMPRDMAAPPGAVTDTSDYQRILFNHIEQYRQHPDDGGQSLKGNVRVMFTMSRDGRVLGVWLKSSSGQPLLDRAAMETVRRAQPLPPIPAVLPDTITLVISIAP